MDRNPLPRLDHSYFDTGRTTEGGFSERFYRELDIKFDELLGEGIKADVAASIQAAIVERQFCAWLGKGEISALEGVWPTMPC